MNPKNLSHIKALGTYFYRFSFLCLFVLVSQSSCNQRDFKKIILAEDFTLNFEVKRPPSYYSKRLMESNRVTLLFSVLDKKEDERGLDILGSVDIYEGEDCEGSSIGTVEIDMEKTKQKEFSLMGKDKIGEGIYSFKLLVGIQILGRDGVLKAGEKHDFVQLDRCSKAIYVDTTEPSGSSFLPEGERKVIKTVSNSLRLRWKEASDKGDIQSGIKGYKLKLYNTAHCEGRPFKERPVVKELYGNIYFEDSIEEDVDASSGSLHSFGIVAVDEVGHHSVLRGKGDCLTIERLHCLPGTTETKNIVDPDNPSVVMGTEVRVCSVTGMFWRKVIMCGEGFCNATSNNKCVPKTSKSLSPEDSLARTGAITPFEISGLTQITHAQTKQKAQATSDRALNVNIGTSSPTVDIGSWHITYDSNFKPCDASGWAKAKPNQYVLPQEAEDGEHKLYLWVADSKGDVAVNPVQSNPFILDTTPPQYFTLTTKPYPKDEGPFLFRFSAEESFSFPITYEVCSDKRLKLCKGAAFKEIFHFPYVVQGLNLGVTAARCFRAVDALGNVSLDLTHSWTPMKRECSFGNVKNEKVYTPGSTEVVGWRKDFCNKRGFWEDGQTVCSKGYVLSEKIGNKIRCEKE